jgi:hypothetical protein
MPDRLAVKPCAQVRGGAAMLRCSARDGLVIATSASMRYAAETMEIASPGWVAPDGGRPDDGEVER